MFNSEEMWSEIRKLNSFARGWSAETNRALKSAVSSSTNGTGALDDSLKPKLKYRDSEIERISFGFLQYGVFNMKGTGRGYKVQNGKAVRVTHREHNASLRKQNDWGKVIDPRFKALADFVVLNKSNQIISTIKF